MLDVVERMRWDHVWMYDLFGQCRRLQSLQKQARERALLDAEIGKLQTNNH